jgi:hypothetical protein
MLGQVPGLTRPGHAAAAAAGSAVHMKLGMGPDRRLLLMSNALTRVP